MPADITKAKNFSLNTDFPLDKVIYLYQGNLTIAGGGIGGQTVAHNLPFIPLTNMVWSTDPSFSTSYMAGSGPDPQDPTLYQLGIDSNVNSDDFNNVVSFTNFLTSSVTIYYKLYSFEPSNSNADIPLLANSGDTFILNSDFNYPKLFMEGTTQPFLSGPIVHGLGYIPQVEAWAGSSTGAYPPQQFINVLDYSSSGIGDRGIRVTNNTIEYAGTASGAIYLFYKIYLDA